MNKRDQFRFGDVKIVLLLFLMLLLLLLLRFYLLDGRDLTIEEEINEYLKRNEFRFYRGDNHSLDIFALQHLRWNNKGRTD